MKKSILIPPLLVIFLLMSGCSKQNNTIGREENSATKQYVSKALGIKFQYPEGFEDKAVEEGNKITYPGWSPTMYIAVLTKKADETIENAILNIVKQEEKNPNDCKIVKRGTEESENEKYLIDLASPIVYTKSEQEEIRLADKNWTPDAGPVDGKYTEKEIYNKRLIEKCSAYADPLGLGTSTSIPSMFLYNDAVSQTKFVFLPGSADPYFHEYGTIEFISE